MNKPHVHAEFIKGWAEGRSIDLWHTDRWIVDVSPTWATDNRYKFTPAPTYVPFTFEDREFLRNKWIRLKEDGKEDGEEDAIWGINSRGVNGISFEGLLKNYEFPDGSPCGKLTE